MIWSWFRTKSNIVKSRKAWIPTFLDFVGSQFLIVFKLFRTRFYCIMIHMINSWYIISTFSGNFDNIKGQLLGNDPRFLLVPNAAPMEEARGLAASAQNQFTLNGYESWLLKFTALEIPMTWCFFVLAHYDTMIRFITYLHVLSYRLTMPHSRSPLQSGDSS